MQDLPAGTSFGRYVLARLLGRGGMGAVYAAVDRQQNDHIVAIKMIETSLPMRPAAIVARFEREARTAGTLDTPHIARSFGAGTDPRTGQPYMVLEYLAGEDLQRLLKRTGALDPDVAMRIAAQACEGLAVAHDAGVIHRDIKPGNLFLARQEGEDTAPAGTDPLRIVKILDFGIAKVLKAAEEITPMDALTRTGSMLGSPLYMSPEQARSVKKVDARADIWSLGVVLYKMLAGRTPFDHVSALGDMILALWNEPPPPVQQFAPWVAPEIAAVVDRMLQVEPADRFPSARAVLEALTPMLPDGTTLRESMLVGIPREIRERSAPLFLRHFDTRSRPPERRGPASRSIPVITLLPDTAEELAANVERPSAGVGSPPTRRSGEPVTGGAVRSSSSAPPGVVTQTDLSTTSESTPRLWRGFGRKAIALAMLGLAFGFGVVSWLLSRPGVIPDSGSGEGRSGTGSLQVETSRREPASPGGGTSTSSPGSATASAETTASTPAAPSNSASALPAPATDSARAPAPPAAGAKGPGKPGVGAPKSPPPGPEKAAARPRSSAAATASPEASGPAAPPPVFTDFGDRK